MNNFKRNLVLFVNYEFVTEQEVESLNIILSNIENPENFCLANELVDRNKITTDNRKLLKESSYYHLRPFRFLINKN